MWVSLNLACLWCGAIELALFIILHVGRVYFTGGFKKPREVTWISGLVLAVIVKQWIEGFDYLAQHCLIWSCNDTAISKKEKVWQRERIKVSLL